MPAKKTIVYECTVCGTEITITGEGLSDLSPVYCCEIPPGAGKKKRSGKAPLKIVSREKTGVNTAKNLTRKSPARKNRRSKE